MDDMTREQRSRNMSRIRSTRTKPEDAVGKMLFAEGLRYRRNDGRYPGKPDFVFPKYKTAVFVNGCFWHQHEGCRYAKLPKSNPEYWLPKLERNKTRDLQNMTAMRRMGWKIAVVWECAVKDSNIKQMLKQLAESIRHGEADGIELKESCSKVIPMVFDPDDIEKLKDAAAR